MFKVNNRNTRCCPGFFIVNSEWVRHVALMYFDDYENGNSRRNTLLP